MFASWLARSLSPATVRIYIAAVRSLHIDLGFTDPTLNANTIYSNLSYTWGKTLLNTPTFIRVLQSAELATNTSMFKLFINLNQNQFG